MKLQTGGRWVAAAVIVAGAIGVSGQSAAPAPAREDVLPALLAEVRGLRAAMEQMASAGPRVQLFASRLQLQEARINNMIRRLDTVRDSAVAARREYDEVLDQVTRSEASLSSQANPQIPRDELEAHVAARKRDLKVAKGTLDRLVGEENQLMQDLTLEQARWNDINQRLDELERMLAKR